MVLHALIAAVGSALKSTHFAASVTRACSVSCSLLGAWCIVDLLIDCGLSLAGGLKSAVRLAEADQRGVGLRTLLWRRRGFGLGHRRKRRRLGISVLHLSYFL